MTSTFSITPKLGFRMVALSSAVSALQEASSISPFLNLLHQVNLDKLQTRSDFKEILSTKYKYVNSLSWLKDFLLQVHSFIEEKTSCFKAQLLDFKRFSVKSIFKVFSRVNDNLKHVIDLDDPESTYFSAELSRNILLDIYDVYLAHVYDKKIKSALIVAVVSECFNVFGGQNNQC